MGKSFKGRRLASSFNDRLGYEFFFYFCKWLMKVKQSFVCISELRGIDLVTFKRSEGLRFLWIWRWAAGISICHYEQWLKKTVFFEEFGANDASRSDV